MIGTLIDVSAKELLIEIGGPQGIQGRNVVATLVISDGFGIGKVPLHQRQSSMKMAGLPSMPLDEVWPVKPIFSTHLCLL